MVAVVVAVVVADLSRHFNIWKAPNLAGSVVVEEAAEVAEEEQGMH